MNYVTKLQSTVAALVFAVQIIENVDSHETCQHEATAIR